MMRNGFYIGSLMVDISDGDFLIGVSNNKTMRKLGMKEKDKN